MKMNPTIEGGVTDSLEAPLGFVVLVQWRLFRAIAAEQPHARVFFALVFLPMAAANGGIVCDDSLIGGVG